MGLGFKIRKTKTRGLTVGSQGYYDNPNRSFNDTLLFLSIQEKELT